MTHPYFHAESSARVFGGVAEDYLECHEWMDCTKEHYANFRHRAMRHHSLGIFQGEEALGKTILNSDGKKVPVRYILEQHVLEDCGGKIPTLADWLDGIPQKSWMSRGVPTSLKPKHQ